jgi:hypothetical protein
LPAPPPTNEKQTLLKKYNTQETRPSSSLTTTSIIFANSNIPPALPNRKKQNGRVQLPPISHVITEKRSKRSRPSKPARRARETRKADDKDAANDLDYLRAKTPDLLHAADFNYIQPQYSYELETGRESVLSTKKKKVKTRKKEAKENILGVDSVK